jgi:hypothetical protein
MCVCACVCVCVCVCVCDLSVRACLCVRRAYVPAPHLGISFGFRRGSFRVVSRFVDSQGGGRQRHTF